MNNKTKIFIEKAKQIHGDKYDYSKVEYQKAIIKVCIICPEHGEFWQTPHNHLNGSGCPKCVGKNKTREDFLKQAKQIHGDKYDYSKVEYVNVTTKVCIICPEHGEFWQLPYAHLKGQGCPNCKGEKISTKKLENNDIFFEKAKKVHGDKYDYSKVKYKGYNEKVCIICPEHGEFWQTPHNHLNGSGCPKCWIKHKLSCKEEFIEKAKRVHGDKYDYSKVEYVNTATKVCIICPEHGEFWQTPNSHLNGSGCKKCANILKRQMNSKNLNTFLNDAFLIHGNKYDYSKVNYINNKTPICIICNKEDKYKNIHGEFWQTPNHHLRGQGCPICKNLRQEDYIFNFLIKNGFNNIERQYAPSFLKEKNGQQTLDFYLPDYNIAIEYQGEQHFLKDNFFKNLEKNLIRDEKKYLKCTNEKIKIIYIIPDKCKNKLYLSTIYSNNFIFLSEINKLLKLIKQ